MAVSYYNHGYVKAFNSKFIAFEKFTEVNPGINDSLRHLFFFIV